MLSLLSLTSLLLISLVASAPVIDDCGGNRAIINYVYASGTKDAKGEKGDTGVAGQAGMFGPKGDRGIIGLPGVRGERGSRGINSESGPRGQKGVKGNFGLQGLSGERGSRGINGVLGPRGLKGDKGNFGLHGLNGETGSTGIRGESGPRGQKGDKGSCKSPQSVAFSVGRRASFTASVDYQVIPMDHVFYNNNNHFNTNSNRFKAPFAGIYAFNYGAGNVGKQMNIFLYAGKPETARARSYAYSTTHAASASGFIILQLKAGETASMRLYKGQTVNGVTNPPTTFFSGFLIQALA